MQMEFTWNAAFVMQSHSWMFRVHQNFDLLIQLMSPLAFRFETEKTHKTLKLHRMNVKSWQVLLPTRHQTELLLGQQLSARSLWMLCGWYPWAMSLLWPWIWWCVQTYSLPQTDHLSVRSEGCWLTVHQVQCMIFALLLQVFEGRALSWWVPLSL